jgi:hypothetical protein
MRWQNILSKKSNVGLALVGVLVVMLLLTFVHKRHLSEVQAAMSSIYMDRLVAETHLYQLSHKIFEKKMLIDRNDDRMLEQNILANDTIQQLMNKYEATYLTADESVQLLKLKDHIRLSQQFENQFISGASPIQRDALSLELAKHYDSILASLNGLTQLQLHEAQKLIDDSNRIVASGNMTSQLAAGMVVVLGLLIYATLSPARLRLEHT